jgi:hypothetical protein
VQDLFTRCFSSLNGEIPISENFKLISAFGGASEPEIFGELQDFIEKNGKPTNPATKPKRF